jgi:nucleotide-binding universal stress UspA family protein
MIYVDRILFPTDGSDCAEHARRHALYLADHFDADLHVIRVEERDVELADVVEVDENDLLADLHGMIRGESPLAESRVRERTIAYPSAAGGILTYGVEHDVDLVVLGTHGKRGVRRLMLGSVAEEVVRKATCPVVTVGRGAMSPEDMDGGTMLVPVDLSEHQDRLLAHVRELAPIYDMDVTVFHVLEMAGVPDAYGVYSSLPDPGKLGDRVRTSIDEEVESLRTSGIDVTVAVKSGHPADQILTYADEIEASFIAIATHGRTGLERMLMGSVAEKVIRRAPCPVCTVKSFGQSLVARNEAEEGGAT